MSLFRTSYTLPCALAGLLSVCMLLGGCERKPEPPPAPPGPSVEGRTIRFPGRVEGLRTEAVQDAGGVELTLPGRLVWDEDHTVRVQAPFAGRVLRPLVTVGDKVRAGQPIAEMASAEFGNAVSEARSAENDVRLADDNLKRLRELHEAGIVAMKELRQAEADFAGKQIEFNRTQTRLRQIGAGDGPNYLLRAPISGIVVERAVNAGQEFRPDAAGLPLFVITDPSRLWVRMDATESDLRRLQSVRVGTAISLATPAYPNQTFPGALSHIGDSIDPESRTFRLRGVVSNPARLLKGEMFVTATFPVGADEAYGRLHNVPASAVMLIGSSRQVFVLDPDGGYRQIEVRLVRESAGRSTVQGLKDGQKVVTEGNLFLQQILSDSKAPPQPVQSPGKRP